MHVSRHIHKNTYNYSGFSIKHNTETLQLTNVFFSIHMCSLFNSSSSRILFQL